MTASTSTDLEIDVHSLYAPELWTMQLPVEIEN